MNIGQNIINNILNEKASIDWNNYLTPEEVNNFLSKEDKVESAEKVIYDKSFNDRFNDFKKSGWTKKDLTKDLIKYYNNGHLNESINDLWISQISKKSNEELKSYLDKLYKQLIQYNSKNSDIKSDDFYDLLNKIDYIENLTGSKPKIGRVLR